MTRQCLEFRIPKWTRRLTKARETGPRFTRSPLHCRQRGIISINQVKKYITNLLETRDRKMKPPQVAAMSGVPSLDELGLTRPPCSSVFARIVTPHRPEHHVSKCATALFRAREVILNRLPERCATYLKVMHGWTGNVQQWLCKKVP